MRFKYMDFEGPEETACYGVKFVRGIAVEVTDPLGIEKLSRNPYFEAVVESVETGEVVFESPALVRRGRPKKLKGA